MDTIMTPEMGGEVAEFVEQWKGKTIRCFGVCHKERKMDKFIGYPHSGGIRDKYGNKYWAYFQCPECGYQHSWAKMDFFQQKTKIEREANAR